MKIQKHQIYAFVEITQCMLVFILAEVSPWVLEHHQYQEGQTLTLQRAGKKNSPVSVLSILPTSKQARPRARREVESLLVTFTNRALGGSVCVGFRSFQRAWEMGRLKV